MKERLQQLIAQAIKKLQANDQLPAKISVTINIDYTKDKKHGDYASNIALALAKLAKMPPPKFAQLLIDHFDPLTELEKVKIAGPGFINFFVKSTAGQHVISDILEQQEKFGQTKEGKGKRVLIEFVSANPTGPLHVGHGRGAAYGSVIADLLKAMGYEVHREYYVNDVGRQMDILTVSVWLRYLELLGEKFEFPANGYRGDYVVEIAESLKTENKAHFKHSAITIFADLPKDEPEGGGKEIYIDALVKRAKELLKEDYEFIHDYGMHKILADIKEDLTEFHVEFDEWFSEKKLMKSGAIQKGIEALKEKDFLYEKEGALWFRSTKFDDEKDRVLIRSNGQTTYFASDVAYHWNKLNRGFNQLIDILGADHHGYVARVRAAVEALGLDHNAIRVPLVQFAILYRQGKKVQMSTRSGSFVTLRELREEVGNDAARFFYVMRKCDQHMDFDLDLAKSKTNENPVYYIQYAHARICSVFRQLTEKKLTFDQAAGLKSLEKLTTDHERKLLTNLSRYTELLTQAAKNLEPHRLVNYLRELANSFHTYYNAEQFLVEDDALRSARLCLILAAKQIIINGLNLLSVSAPEKM